ncbi:MAG: phenylacetate--CoA ligase family protein [Candidatus Omnitrophica bacterium]|nr:phenylacetate--CoA ligase family protein [Candidatus Omnitrophota bacterium]
MLSALADKIAVSLPAESLGGIIRTTPRSLTDWKRDQAFRKLILYAYNNSPFYRKKFKELGIDPKKVAKPSDLGDFYTTTLDVIEHAEEFLCKPPHMVFESSGTTGRNKRVYFSQTELDDIGHFNAAGLFLGGVLKTDRFINAFDFNIWIPGMITHKSIEHARILGMAAGKVDPMEVYKRIPVYNFNVVLGEPTWLIKLTEIAEKKGAFPLKFIIAGAEAMPYAARPWMEKVWHGAKVRMVYASVESGGIIAFEPFGECNSYHIDENNFYVEVVNQAEDGYGEIVFSTLTRRTMPLIRYKNNDISKIIEEKCACGIPYRRLAFMRGRSDEMVIASGGNLYPLMFDDIMKDVEGITSDWQIIFRLRGVKEVMEFNLELKEGASKDMVKGRIFSNIQSRYPDLWKNMDIAIFETEFAYHQPGFIRAGKHKILRLIDKRY